MQQQAFNLEGVLAQAAQVTQQQEEHGSDGMKLVYPQPGTLKVRLLYNNAAGIVMRKFERHKINGQQVICLQNYGMDCPICKMVDNIQNATGVDLWKLKRVTRGIAYAEYIDSDYKFDDPKNEPKSGEIVLLMFPWTIYADLNRLIASAGQNIYSLIASNTGGIFKISRWTESKQTKYRAEIDPFDQQHKTCESEEAYQKLLMNLPSLNDRIVPIEPNDNIINMAQSVSNELNQEYLSTRVQQPNMGQAGATLNNLAQSYTDQFGNQYELINGQWVLKNNLNSVGQFPQQPQSQPQSQAAPGQHLNQSQVPQQGNLFQNTQVTGDQLNSSGLSSNSSNISCYGKYGSSDINPNNCLLCPSEGQCRIEASH